jgi:hypothetical protein
MFGLFRDLHRIVSYGGAFSLEFYMLYCVLRVQFEGYAEYIVTSPLLAAVMALPMFVVSTCDYALGKRRNLTLGGNFKDFPSALGLLFWNFVWWTSLFTIFGSVLLTILRDLARTAFLTVVLPQLMALAVFVGSVAWLVVQYRRFWRVRSARELPSLALDATTIIAFWVAFSWASAAYVRCHPQMWYASTVTALALILVYRLAGAFDFGTIEHNDISGLRALIAGTIWRGETISPVYDNTNTHVVAHSVTVRRQTPGCGTTLLIGMTVVVVIVLWVPVANEVQCHGCWEGWLREMHPLLIEGDDKEALRMHILKRCEPASITVIDTLHSIVGSAGEIRDRVSGFAGWASGMISWTGAAVEEEAEAEEASPPPTPPSLLQLPDGSYAECYDSLNLKPIPCHAEIE